MCAFGVSLRDEPYHDLRQYPAAFPPPAQPCIRRAQQRCRAKSARNCGFGMVPSPTVRCQLWAESVACLDFFSRSLISFSMSGARPCRREPL